MVREKIYTQTKFFDEHPPTVATFEDFAKYACVFAENSLGAMSRGIGEHISAGQRASVRYEHN